MTLADNLTTGTALSPELAAAFPADFLWGAATSSYQIEGATHEDGRGESVWDRFAATPGKTYEGDSGDVAADHYHRMVDDVALIARLGLGAYRFSIAWPRILPQGTGAVNDKGLDFYDRLVDELLRHNITPMATLFHWDMPLTLEDAGGWPNRETAYAFADYAEVVARRLGDRVSRWITLNEPWCSAFLGYGNGEHAPGIKDNAKVVAASHHLLLAHGLAVPRLRANSRSDVQVGITLNLSPAYRFDDNPETIRAYEEADAFSNRWFLDPVMRGTYPELIFERFGARPEIQDGDMEIISTPLDFLGVNYYSRHVVQSNSGAAASAEGEPDRIPGSQYTEMGWEVYPQGLTDLLERVHRDYAPPALIVTENGAAFTDVVDEDGSVHDPQRLQFLREHVGSVARAIQAGVPMTGYFVWSLMDNFEWAYGYSKRFGIVYVDYPTQSRILKDSGRWYADLIREVHQS